MSRLVVVSNRLPLGPNPSGGLVVALADALDGGGLWIGNSGKTRSHAGDTLTAHDGAPFDRLSYDLSAREHREYYLGFSNAVLWPLCHGRVDLIEVRTEDLHTYRNVNRKVARIVAGQLREDDRIWVQDYHHLPLAHELRKLGVRNPIAFFLHIPFPGPMAFQALPNAAETARWIVDYDLFGLQAKRHVAACLQALRTVEGAEFGGEGRVTLGGKTVEIASFPIGIDVDDFLAQAEGAQPRPDRPDTIIGVDRLDYSKGLPERFRAFESLLTRRPDLHGEIELLQIAPPTRGEVRAYREIREEIEGLTGAINGAHADLDWIPIRYIHRPVPRERLAKLFRRARIGLVTPLADGMNLVAKEFVAAQDPADPGVLILSKFAGAAEQMTEALIVNPHDMEEMVHHIVTARSMPLRERQRRHEALMTSLRENDVHQWRRSILMSLDRISGARDG